MWRMPMSCGPTSKFHVVRQSLTAEKLGNQSYHEWDQHPLLPARGAPVHPEVLPGHDGGATPAPMALATGGELTLRS